MKKRIVSLLLALVMVLSLVPATVWAAENHDGQVRVVVENTTYAKANGAAWDGTLSAPWVPIPRPARSPATSARSTACPPVTAAQPPAGWEP